MTEPTINLINPTADELLGQYRTELERMDYSSETVHTYLRVTRKLLQLTDEYHVTLANLTADLAVQLIRRWADRGQQAVYDATIARRFVAFLTSIGVATAPALTSQELALAALRRDYEDYLRRHRGLSERTIYHCWRFAVRFLEFRFGQAEAALSAITTADVAAFLQELTTRKAPYRDKTPPTHLRNFFQFMFKNALITSNLALCVPSVAQRYNSRLPRFLSPGQVETLLAAVRAEEPNAYRNHAMVLLQARLGLRGPEVVAMQLDDIDWRAGELIVRGKGKNHDRLPLPPDVGAALAEYIRHDRTSTSRTLFVSARPPHRPFKNSQVLNTILKAAFKRTGMAPPCQYVGSHVLRHSLATNLVRQGASLTEVGDMLRHRSRASTLIYAKLDIDGLRSLAQAWPAEGGVR